MIITCQTLQSLQDFWDFAITEINTQSSKITGGPCNFSKLPGIFCTFWSRLVILHHHNADSAKPLFDLHALNMSTAKTSHLQTSLQKTVENNLLQFLQFKYFSAYKKHSVNCIANFECQTFLAATVTKKTLNNPVQTGFARWSQ